MNKQNTIHLSEQQMLELQGCVDTIIKNLAGRTLQEGITILKFTEKRLTELATQKIDQIKI